MRFCPIRDSVPRPPCAGRALLAAAALLAGVGSGCSSIAVKSDWDREFDFAQYRTYRWAPTPKLPKPGAGPDRGLLDRRIRRAVDRELAAKGFRRQERGKADFLLVYHVTLRTRVDVYTDWGYPRRWGYGTSVHRYREGTLLLNVVDPRLDHSVWQGWAVGVVGDPEKAEAKVNEAVAKILERFPPK